MIEWRKKYRKYKPRKHPGKCVFCSAKRVMAAYHTICTECAKTNRCCAKCHFSRDDPNFTRRPDVDAAVRADCDVDSDFEGRPADEADAARGEIDAASADTPASIVKQIKDAELARLRAMHTDAEYNR